MFTPVDWPAPDLLARLAERRPDRPALLDADTGDRWTYAELSSGPVDELAAGIRAAGLGPADRLGTLLAPGARMAQLVHAAARAGCVLVPLPPDAPADVVRERGATAAVDALVVGADRDGAAVRAFDGPVYSARADSDAFEPLPGGLSAAQPRYRWRPDEDRWLVFTSGSVGEPKPVRLTAGNLLASATASALRLGVSPDDRWFDPLPMHHVGGLAPLVRSALYGTAVVVQAGFDTDATAAALAGHDATGVSLVPTMLRRLLDAGWSPSPSLRFVLLGGAAASRSLIERCRDANVPVHPTYGLTETASQVATAPPAEAFAHPGTVGRPLPGVDVRVEADGGVASTGEPGELVVAGPTVSPGYAGDAAEAADRFEDGAFHTRDRGYRDGDGRLWVLGRLDDALVTGGETVQPAVVEAALAAHPAVRSAAVVGLPDDEWGEVVGALVVRAEPVDAGTLLADCRERLEPHAVPQVVAFADTLPRTASGTVDRDAVRDRLRGENRPGGL
ncbi:MAG: class I adenylate-forming enzyme family protein [Halobacteriales archaeon]